MPFCWLLSALEIWPQASALSSAGIDIGPRHARPCVVQPGGTGLTSWKGKGRGKSWNAGDDSHLPSPIIFGDRGNVPHCSPQTHTLSTEEKVFSAPLHFCLISVFRNKQGVEDTAKQTQNTHTPSKFMCNSTGWGKGLIICNSRWESGYYVLRARPLCRNESIKD